MAKFKLSVSTPDGKVQNVEVEGDRAQPLIGRNIGETVDGIALGLQGARLEITGGSDREGFPMRKGIRGGVRSQVLLSRGVGFHTTKHGERRRKLVRGSTITEDTAQVNLKTLKAD
jgi:small subunit ribosomal protein S6e